MAKVRIASVSNENKDVLETILMSHGVSYKFKPTDNRKGYHVYVERNHDLYFREVVAPEYKRSLLIKQDKDNGRYEH